jgi:asparagine synthase (glutamine-hydrolysing)
LIVAVGAEREVARIAARAADAGYRTVHRSPRRLIARRERSVYNYVDTTGGLVSVDGRTSVRALPDALQVENGPCGGRAVFAASTARGQAWVVTSSIDFAAKTSEGGKALDAEWLAARFLHEHPFSPTTTLYRDVVAVPSGTQATFRPDRAAAFTNVEPAPARETTIDDVRTALEDTARRYVAHEAHVAVLAGGIDSCSLAALSANAGAELRPVCLDLGQADEDRPFVEKVCQLHGRSLLLVDPKDAVAELAPDLTIDGAPLLFPTAPHIQVAMRRAARAGARAVWMGIGGDELFEGCARSASLLLRKGRVREALSLARALSDGSARDVARSVAINLLWASSRAFVPSMLRAQPVETDVPSWAGPTMRRHGEERRDRSFRARPPWEQSRGEKLRRFFRWSSYDLVAFDRNQYEEQTGVVRLDPYLDPEVVRATVCLPDHELVKGGVPRAPLREAVRGILPEEVRLRRDKASFERACDAMLDALPASRLLPLADATAVADLGLIELKPFRDECIAFLTKPEARPDGWVPLWPVLATEAFIRGAFGLPGRFTGWAS